MGLQIFIKRYATSILLSQMRKLFGYSGIHGRMSGDVCRIVRKRSQSEGIFVNVAGFANKGGYKVSASYVVDEIAKEPVAERIVPHVLN